MLGAAPRAARGQREVLGVGRVGRPRERVATRGVRGVEPGARLVEALAGRRLVGRRDAAQPFLQRLDASLAIAEERDARRLERIGVGRGVEGAQAVALDFVGLGEVVLESHDSGSENGAERWEKRRRRQNDSWSRCRRV